jgi:tRNA threonylcarbamoyladenosine biosynthesis protein TsaB
VGVASAKGIALALTLPTAGVTSLEALAAAAFGDGRASPGDRVASVLDAKKGELFLAVFDASLAEILSPTHVPRAEAPDALRPLLELGRLVIVGEATSELASLGSSEPRHEGEPPIPLDLPDAAWVGRVAAKRLAAGGGQDPAVLEALYVRAPDAVRAPNAKLPLLG